MFSLQVQGAVAQLERTPIAERTKAGIAAAVKRGSLPGNQGMRSRDPAAIRKIGEARRDAFVDRLINTAAVASYGQKASAPAQVGGRRARSGRAGTGMDGRTSAVGRCGASFDHRWPIPRFLGGRPGANLKTTG
jgi:hypothetical protein